jgi:hypothetical protein
MFKLIKTEPTVLDNTINQLQSEMAGVTADSPEYSQMADQLVKLMHLKSDTGPKRVSPDALVSALASLGGILVIVSYEHAHVIGSKALGFVKKP